MRDDNELLFRAKRALIRAPLCVYGTFIITLPTRSTIKVTVAAIKRLKVDFIGSRGASVYGLLSLYISVLRSRAGKASLALTYVRHAIENEM